MTALLAHLLRRQRTLLLSSAVFLLAVEAALVHVLAEIETSGGLDELVSALGSFLESFVRSQLPEVSGRYSLAVVFRDPALLIPPLACVIVAVSQPAADVADGTLEMQLARPLPRARYLAAHLLAGLIAALLLPATLVAGLAIGLATAEFPGAPALSVYVGSAAGLAALMLFFAGLGLWLSAGSRRRAPVVGRLAALAVPGFLLDTLGRAWAPLAPLRPLSPFYYFDPAAVLPANPAPAGSLVPQSALALQGLGSAVPEGELWMPALGPVGNGALLVGLGALFAALAFRRFGRRDV